MHSLLCLVLYITSTPLAINISEFIFILYMQNKASGVDFVKDGRKELTLSSSFDLAENEG